jgi:hypothetical protein
MKLPTHRAGSFDRAHGPEYVEWASRQGIIVHIVPLYPAYPALAGRGTFRSQNFLRKREGLVVFDYDT